MRGLRLFLVSQPLSAKALRTKRSFFNFGVRVKEHAHGQTGTRELSQTNSKIFAFHPGISRQKDQEYNRPDSLWAAKISPGSTLTSPAISPEVDIWGAGHGVLGRSNRLKSVKSVKSLPRGIESKCTSDWWNPVHFVGAQGFNPGLGVFWAIGPLCSLC